MARLPTELLADIFRLALPLVEFITHPTAWRLLGRIRMLYTLRSVTKRWQNIIDGTPTFWTYIQSTLPPHVNEATIIRSEDGPLTVVYPNRTAPKAYDPVSPKRFVLSLAPTFHRWSGYSGPVVPGYLDKPAPHLTKISLRSGDSRMEPFDLLGGSTTNLRHVELEEVPIPWRIGIFTQLQVLRLVSPSMGSGDLTTPHILDALLASPFLELDHVFATIETPPPSPVITLPGLRYIIFNMCEYHFTGAILRQIRAPSCIDFDLSVDPEDEEESHQLFNEDLQVFHKLFRAIHNRNGSSEVRADMTGFKWESSPEGLEGHPTFSIAIRCGSLIPYTHWVGLILQHDPGLGIHLQSFSGVSQEMLIWKTFRDSSTLEAFRDGVTSP